MNKTKRSMVIIDDEVNVLKMLSELVETKGWSVFAVPTGEAGVDVIKEEEVDVVLLDVTLPGKSGLEVLRDIKKEKKMTMTPEDVAANIPPAGFWEKRARGMVSTQPKVMIKMPITRYSMRVFLGCLSKYLSSVICL